MDEIRDFHPLVENWLTANGYTFQHHVKLEDGIADYIAERNNELIVVECKADGSKSEARTGRFFAQVLDYARQVPNSKPYVALPTYLFTNKTQEICKYYDIGLILIECDEPDEDLLNKPFERIFLNIPAIIFKEGLIKWTESTVKDIVKDHVENDSNPIFDLMLAFFIASAAHPDFFSDRQVKNAQEILIDSLLYLASDYFSESDIEGIIHLIAETSRSYVLPRL
jgi:hypothetical protein